MKKNLTLLVVLLALSLQALASQTDKNKSISKLAVEAGDKGYFTSTSGFTLSCQYGVVYFDMASDSGKGYLSMLLASKMSGNTVSVTYNQEANDICNVTHVVIE